MLIADGLCLQAKCCINAIPCQTLLSVDLGRYMPIFDFVDLLIGLAHYN